MTRVNRLPLLLLLVAGCVGDEPPGTPRSNSVPAVPFELVAGLPTCDGLTLGEREVAAYDVAGTDGLYAIDDHEVVVCMDHAEGVARAGVLLGAARGRCFGPVCRGEWYDGTPLEGTPLPW